MHKFSPRGAKAAQQSVAANHTGSREGGGGGRRRKRRGGQEQIRGLAETFLRGRPKDCWFVSQHPVGTYQSSLSNQRLVAFGPDKTSQLPFRI